MGNFILRPASESDFSAIRALVRASHINPTGLKWARFVIAELPDGKLIACGQIKPHSDGSVEIASIAVQPDYRKQGIARAIIENLMSDAPRPLHLICRFELGVLYEKFGFYPVQAEGMPRYFRRLLRLASLVELLSRGGTSLLVMCCD